MSPFSSPLRFRRRFFEKVWGGRSLERVLGIALPEGPIGETWEIVDRDGENSEVEGGPFAGRTLGELVREHERELLGKAPASRRGRFPVLVKYIDASQALSVQVHPHERTIPAARRGDWEGKTEAWYVLDAAPGSVLYCGLRDGVDERALRERCRGPEVVECLRRWEVRPGDFMLVPGGTVHAIGAGVTLLEVQENSDTTFRIYDWGRLGLDGEPRATHVEEALASIDFELPARAPLRAEWLRASATHRRAPMARTLAFAVNLLALEGPTRFSTAGQYRIYVALAGSGEIVVRETGERAALAPGESRLVPARAGYHVIEPHDGELVLMEVLHRA